LYILDRDVSISITQPTMLNEADIDLELPEENPADGIGVLYSATAAPPTSFFRKRVQSPGSRR
jgi:hypothetical protein